MRLRTLCLVLFVGLCARPVAAAPILSIEPGTSTVNQGDTFFLDIDITNVTDLFGFQFDILVRPHDSDGERDGGGRVPFHWRFERFSFRGVHRQHRWCTIALPSANALIGELVRRKRERRPWRAVELHRKSSAAPVRISLSQSAVPGSIRRSSDHDHMCKRELTGCERSVPDRSTRARARNADARRLRTRRSAWRKRRQSSPAEWR